MSYLAKYFTVKAIWLYVLLLFFCALLFGGRGLPVVWIAFGLLQVILFFGFINFLSVRWLALSDAIFRKKLFYNALWIRLLYVILIYFFYQAMTGKPFEFQAADAEGYHNEAIWLVGLFRAGKLSIYSDYINGRFSDMGFPVYLAIYYYIFGAVIIIPRLANAFLGAWMCVSVYKLALRNFGPAAARLAAIMAMLLPTLIYYCGLHLKETLMTYLCVAFIERIDYLVHDKKKILLNSAGAVLLGLSVFFFRTVLAVALCFAAGSMVMFSGRRIANLGRRLLAGAWLTILVLIVLSTDLTREVNKYVDQRDVNLQNQMQYFSQRKGGNRFATYGRSSIFIPMMLVVPFPSLVDTGQENAMMINGAVYTRNIYAFFVFLAIVAFIKKKQLRQHALILSFLFSYLVVLAMSGHAISERFHLPAVPFLLILAGYGVTQLDRRNKNYYIPYLLVIALVILAWNWFKLAGRGAI